MQTKTFYRSNRNLFIAPHNFVIFLAAVFFITIMNNNGYEHGAFALGASLLGRTFTVLRSKHRIHSMNWITTLLIIPIFLWGVVCILDLIF